MATVLAGGKNREKSRRAQKQSDKFLTKRISFTAPAHPKTCLLRAFIVNFELIITL